MHSYVAILFTLIILRKYFEIFTPRFSLSFLLSFRKSRTAYAFIIYEACIKIKNQLQEYWQTKCN